MTGAGGTEIGRGTLAPIIDARLLDAVYGAYVEAAGGTPAAVI